MHGRRRCFSRIDHRGSYLQMHFALDGPPTFAEPYQVLNDPDYQSAIGITPDQIARITCPIGDPALGKHPQSIALGVATQMLRPRATPALEAPRRSV